MRNLFIFFILFLLSACGKRIVDNTPLESNWLLPLVKGNISLNDLSRLEGTTFDYVITPAQINQPTNTPVSSPAFTVDFIGPFTVPTQDIIKYLKVDSIELGIHLKNIFPVNIQSGFTVTLRSSDNTASSSNVLFSKTFSNAIAAQSQDSLPLSIHNVTIADSLYFYIENLNIDAFNQVVFNENVPVQFTIDKVRLNELAFFPNKNFSISDTVEFSSGDLSSIYDAGGNTLADSAVSGFLNLFTDNGLPVNLRMQMTFLKNNLPVDSVFENSFILNGAGVDAAGIPNSIDAKKNSVAIRKVKLKNIESCDRMIYSFSINTDGYTSPQVIMGKQNKLALQIVSDIALMLNPFQL
ncbi:MAG: hypothetical protein JNJ58_11550 [Chitinophagaceae bacterium]|nr:hypothetical protein [Chitinophagaceae bacterium]